MGPGRVGVIALIDQPGVQADNIAFLQNPVPSGYAVHHFLVDRHTDRRGKPSIIQEVGNTSQLPDQFVSKFIDIHGGDARTDHIAHFIMYDLQQASCSRINSISFADLIVTAMFYAPSMPTIAWNTASISIVPSTSFKMPFLL